MLLQLSIRKLVHIHSSSQSRLSCLSLLKIIHYCVVRVKLLNVLVPEVNNSVSIWEDLFPNLLLKNDFFLSILVSSDYLPIFRDLFIDWNCILR
jgi:hypothetical protein